MDFINAARSALRVTFESNAKSPNRPMGHTKTNYPAYGDTVRYVLDPPEDGGTPAVRFDGFSEVTRETLETAARRGTTPAALRREAEAEEAWKGALCEAVVTLAREAETLPLRVSYAEVTERFGADVFGGKQPKRALEAVLGELHERGVRVEMGVTFIRNRKHYRGFTIHTFAQNPDRE